MSTAIRKPRAKKAPSKQIVARKSVSVDDQFLALLRRKCTRAATIGAVTAATEAIPGLGKLLRLAFGELLDAAFLAKVQRELVEETLELYGVNLPAVIKNPLVEKIQVLGTGASIGGDAFLRGLLKRALGRVGGLVVARAVPLVPIVTSASTNAAVTYAIGKRAQAVAKLKDASLADMTDVVRAFTGVDERRIYAWSVTAVKDAINATGKFFGRVTKFSSRGADKSEAGKKPRARKRSNPSR